MIPQLFNQRDYAVSTVDKLFDEILKKQFPELHKETGLLFSQGSYPKVNVIDFEQTDALSNINGATGYTLDGYQFLNGSRVIFAADQDPVVNSKIYVLNLVQYEVDSYGQPTGPKYIDLTLATDGVVDPYATVVVKLGGYQGSQWWYDGIKWNSSQQKTSLQQAPLFDVVDENGYPVPDGTVVTFASSNNATIAPNTSATSNGVAGTSATTKVNFIANSENGTSTITAISGNYVGSATVTIGTGNNTIAQDASTAAQDAANAAQVSAQNATQAAQDALNAVQALSLKVDALFKQLEKQIAALTKLLKK